MMFIEMEQGRQSYNEVGFVGGSSRSKLVIVWGSRWVGTQILLLALGEEKVSLRKEAERLLIPQSQASLHDLPRSTDSTGDIRGLKK
jgi:hypothetical protein